MLMCYLLFRININTHTRARTQIYMSTHGLHNVILTSLRDANSVEIEAVANRDSYSTVTCTICARAITVIRV